MKIISKYKDYYDYLSGIYGVDEKLILERKSSLKKDSLIAKLYGEKIKFVGIAINDVLYHGIYHTDSQEFYYGEELRDFEYSNGRKYWYTAFQNLNPETTVSIKDKPSYSRYLDLSTVPLKTTINTFYDCPVVLIVEPILESNSKIVKMPILSHVNFTKYLSPEKTYQEISAFLSKQISNAENQETVISNKDKIESKGFDPKRSFRPQMKY